MKQTKKHLVVLSGAGISAESGIKTFRDSDGLWENYPVQEVASIEGWHRNPRLMLDFYNQRRAELTRVEPNPAHRILHELEDDFEVDVITQNVDNLHERAGSRSVLHLHGELTKAQSDKNPFLIKEIGYAPIQWGDLAPDGSQWRPHIVWFGEAVPNIEKAAEWVALADIFLVVGTSLNVYPAAGLLHYRRAGTPLWLIDPRPALSPRKDLHIIAQGAAAGMELFRQEITRGL